MQPNQNIKPEPNKQCHSYKLSKNTTLAHSDNDVPYHYHHHNTHFLTHSLTLSPTLWFLLSSHFFFPSHCRYHHPGPSLLVFSFLYHSKYINILMLCACLLFTDNDIVDCSCWLPIRHIITYKALRQPLPLIFSPTLVHFNSFFHFLNLTFQTLSFTFTISLFQFSHHHHPSPFQSISNDASLWWLLSRSHDGNMHMRHVS